MATLKPTLSLWTPPAAATPTPVSAPTPTTTSTATSSASGGKTLAQIQAEATAKREANQAAASTPFDKAAYDADRIAFAQSQNNTSAPVIQSGPARVSAGYNPDWTFYSQTTSRDGTVKSVWAPTPPTPKTTTPNLRTDAINYRTALSTSKGDKAAYTSSIGYDKLSPNQKKVADGIYDAGTKKKNINKDETPIAPIVPEVPAVPEKTRAEMGLKPITPTGIPKGVPTIKELVASGLSPADAIEARRQAIKDRSAPKPGSLEDITQKNIYDKALEIARKTTTDAKDGTMDDLEMQKETNKKSYELMDEFFQSEGTNIQTLTDEYTKSLQDTQTGFENQRFNQVRSQLIQSLAARGIDVSTVPPEQLIALSGEVGVAAFNDVYEKKTAMQARINEAKEKALTQLRELRAKKALNEDEYNKNVTNLTTAANAKNRELDVAFNNTFLGIAEKKLTQTDVAQATALNVLTQAGIDPSIMGSVLGKVNGAANANEANKLVYDWLATPEGSKAYKDAVAAKNSAAVAENELKKLEIQANNAYRAGSLTNDTAKMFQQLSNQYAQLALDPLLTTQKEANAALATKYANMATGIITWTPSASASTGWPWQWSPN